MRACVCVCVRVCACVRACVRTCVRACVRAYTALSPDERGRFQPDGSHFFLFFYSVLGKKIIFYDSPIRFCVFRIFDFPKIYFYIFLMIEFKFSNQIESIQNSTKNLYLKKNFSSYHGSFIIKQKRFFGLKSL